MSRHAARRAFAVVALLALLGGLNAASAVHATIGSQVDDPEMPTADGSKSRALRDVEASVLVFFRPDQERSTAALRQLAECQSALAGKSIHWAAVVSDSSPLDKAAALVRDSKFAGPVLLDKADALYGSLGIALHPVVVLVDRQRKLAAFEPFRAVNFCPVVGARIRHLLREISEQEMLAIIDPPAAAAPSPGGAGGRYRSLAEALLKSGNLDKALDNIRKSLEIDPTAARSHALLGDIERARGDCESAARAYAKALTIDPAQPAAMQGLERCKSGR